MKSIVYILITVFISSMLISAIPKSEPSNRQTITIQCLDDSPSPDLLKKSVEIIQSRLADYGLQDADVIINKSLSCIDITLNKEVDLLSLTALTTSNGKIEFYEIHDRLEVIRKLGEVNELATILHIPEDGREINRFSGVLGYCKEDKKSEVALYLKNHYVSETGKGINFYWSELPRENGDFYLYILNHQSSLDNSSISASAVEINKSDNTPELMITFDKSGKTIWADLTKRNIGKSIAIVLDKRVISAPTVKSEIREGKCMITGDFSMDEISRMNSLFNNEELPLAFKLKN